MEDKMSNDRVSLPTEIYVPINDRSIKVSKLGLLKYASMTKILRELIASIIQFFQEQEAMQASYMDAVLEDTETTAPTQAQKAIDVAQLVSSLVEKNVVQVINFLDLCVPDAGREYLEEKVGLYDLVLLVDAILNVNQVNKAIEEGKKLVVNYMQSRMSQL